MHQVHTLCCLMSTLVVQRLSPEEEAAKLRRTIFVGNLPSTVNKKMLQAEFGQ